MISPPPGPVATPSLPLRTWQGRSSPLSALSRASATSTPLAPPPQYLAGQVQPAECIEPRERHLDRAIRRGGETLDVIHRVVQVDAGGGLGRGERASGVTRAAVIGGREGERTANVSGAGNPTGSEALY